jgi:hypothetical protein
VRLVVSVSGHALHWVWASPLCGCSTFAASVSSVLARLIALPDLGLQPLNPTTSRLVPTYALLGEERIAG